MFRKILSLVITALLMQVTYVQPVAANAGADEEARFAEKVKAGIAKLGTGTEARIEVKLRDKRKLKGYISEASDKYFIVVDDKTGAATTVTYPQVKSVKGNNLSEGVKLAIGVGVILAIVFIVAASLK
jgi:hypothetical protein